jgi:hypothetical protein
MWKLRAMVKCNPSVINGDRRCAEELVGLATHPKECTSQPAWWEGAVPLIATWGYFLYYVWENYRASQ